LFAASIDQLPFASPHIGHADSPTARAWIWSAACSLSADGISCDSFSPRAGRRRRAGGAAGSTSAACRHWGAGRGTSLAPFLLCLLSFFLLFLAPTWPPGSPAPPARQPRSRTGRLVCVAIRLQRGGTCQPAPPRRPPAPQGRFSAPPPRWDAARCVRLRRFARGCFPYRGLWAVSHVLVHPAPPRKGSQRSRRHRLRLTSAARFKGAGRHSPPPTRPRTASGRPRAILDQRTKFPSTF
jgi:hypothetical protein